MKKCPNCNMTTNSHSECCVCKADITEVKYCDSKRERYVFNKYLIPYILKNHIFMVLCTIATVVITILSGFKNGWYHLAPFILIVYMIADSLYHEMLMNILARKYSDAYIETHFQGGNSLLGVIGVVMAALLCI